METVDPEVGRHVLLKDEASTAGDEVHATNELPAPEATVPEATVDHVDDQGDHGQHTAFLPTLQFASGNELASISVYEHQQNEDDPLRTAEHDAPAQTFDHWPTDTQTQVQDDASMQNGNQFTQGDSASHFDQSAAPEQYHQEAAEQHRQDQQQQQQHQQQQQQHHHHHNQEHHMHHHGGTPYDRPQPGASYGTYDGSKPKRKRASPQQLTLLNNIFEMTYFPSSDLRLAIGKELDMVPRSVQIWFQNRRSLWRAKAGQILNENKQRKAELLATGLSEEEADARVISDRAEAAARQIADQRANDAVEYAINGSTGSLAYALHGAAVNAPPPAIVDDGSVTRDDEAGAWSVLQAFHQARTGVMIQQGHPPQPQRPPSGQQV